MYYLPWNDVVLAGTTENSLDKPVVHPIPREDKVKEILENVHDSFPGKKFDVLS